jgi:ribose 1,5-bisphosphokinase
MTVGRLVLVVGPSGAGKDSILRYAKNTLTGDDRFVFPRRIITRLADIDAEDHDTIDPDSFDAMADRDAFALFWEAHGLKYGVPATIDEQLRRPCVVSINVSRASLADAARRYPNAIVVEVSAPSGVLARRIAARGRETPENARLRALRDTPPIPKRLTVHRIRNDASLAKAGEAFRRLLQDTLAAMLR